MSTAPATPPISDHSNPNPAPSYHPETPKSDRKAFYAAQLHKIPGFHAYSYRSSNSTQNNEVADTHRSVQLKFESPSPRLASEQRPTVGNSSARRANNRESVLSHILPRLEQISQQRDILLQLEFKIEAAHRKLANYREALKLEVHNGDDTIGRDFVDAASLRDKWRDYQGRLHNIVSEIVAEEDELEPLQQDLTYTQSLLKTAGDDLYASLTGGIRPGGSIVSAEEDRILEAVATGVYPNRVLETQVNADGDILPRHIDLDEVRRQHQTAESQRRLLASDHHNDTPPASSRPMSPTNGQKPRLMNPTEPEIVPRTESTGSMTEVRGGSNRTFDLFGKYLGTHVSHQDLQKAMSKAARESLLHAAPEQHSARRADMKFALGYDIMLVVPNMKWTEQLKKVVTSGVAQKLTNLDVPDIHTEQLIALWGQKMSQNAAIETSRTIMCGGKKAEELSRKDDPDPLTRLMQDVRRLKVPLEHTDTASPQLVAVADDTLSVEPQPSENPTPKVS